MELLEQLFSKSNNELYQEYKIIKESTKNTFIEDGVSLSFDMPFSFLCNKSKSVLSQVSYINNVPVRVCARQRCKDTTVQSEASSLS